LVSLNGCQALFQKILNLTNIDILEQSIKCLSKVSIDFGDVILALDPIPVLL